MKFKKNQIFKDTYSHEAAEWCNSNNCRIIEIDTVDNVRHFKIVGIDETEKTPEELEEEFKNEFFFIPDKDEKDSGYYFRKIPKGYNSAIESLNTAFNIVSVTGILPKDTLTFYKKPDYSEKKQCSENWLIKNSFKNEEMTAEEFGEFYARFIYAWNKQEHIGT